MYSELWVWRLRQTLKLMCKRPTTRHKPVRKVSSWAAVGRINRGLKPPTKNGPQVWLFWNEEISLSGTFFPALLNRPEVKKGFKLREYGLEWDISLTSFLVFWFDNKLYMPRHTPSNSQITRNTYSFWKRSHYDHNYIGLLWWKVNETQSEKLILNLASNQDNSMEKAQGEPIRS